MLGRPKFFRLPVQRLHTSPFTPLILIHLQLWLALTRPPRIPLSCPSHILTSSPARLQVHPTGRAYNSLHFIQICVVSSLKLPFPRPFPFSLHLSCKRISRSPVIDLIAFSHVSNEEKTEEKVEDKLEGEDAVLTSSSSTLTPDDFQVKHPLQVRPRQLHSPESHYRTHGRGGLTTPNGSRLSSLGARISKRSTPLARWRTSGACGTTLRGLMSSHLGRTTTFSRRECSPCGRTKATGMEASGYSS